MAYTNIANENIKELLEAQTHIWNHIFAYHHSMALKCAIDLGIPDAIDKHGRPMKVHELANHLGVLPNKTPTLHRLLRLLVHSNFFSIKKSVNGEDTYDLNTNSRLLLKHHPCSLAHFTLGMLDLKNTEPPHYLSRFLKNMDESAFNLVHGKSFWELASSEPTFNLHFNAAMSSDAGFVSTVLVANDNFKAMMEGLESFVDVAGGQGIMAKAIANAFPKINCVAFDLPHVVDGLKGNGRNFDYIAGDMFVKIPPADAVMLKWILHDWSDEHCVKILERCKEAIPACTGKLIIIDIVVEHRGDDLKQQQLNAQLLSDMEMMALTVGGKERTENEWMQLFFKVGFNRYNIYRILGMRSVIELQYN